MSVKDLLELYQLVKEAEEEDVDIEDVDIEDLGAEDIEDIDVEDLDIDEEDLDEDVVEDVEEMLDYADALEKTAELYRMAALEDLVKSAARKKKRNVKFTTKMKRFFKKYWPAMLAGGAAAGVGTLVGLAARKKKREKTGAANPAEALKMLGLEKTIAKQFKGRQALDKILQEQAKRRLQNAIVKDIVKSRLKEFFSKNWPWLTIGGAGATAGLLAASLASKKKD
ncbi:MAG: hypothetical protein QW650_00270 [Thermofilum sp.]